MTKVWAVYGISIFRSECLPLLVQPTDARCASKGGITFPSPMCLFPPVLKKPPVQLCTPTLPTFLDSIPDNRTISRFGRECGFPDQVLVSKKCGRNSAADALAFPSLPHFPAILLFPRIFVEKGHLFPKTCHRADLLIVLSKTLLNHSCPRHFRVY